MKKGITFQTNNEIYQLRFSVNNLCKLEDLLGKPLSKLGDNIGLRELRLMLYCGITPSMSLEECGEVLDDVIAEKGVEELNSILTKALNLSMGSTGVSPVEAVGHKKKV